MVERIRGIGPEARGIQKLRGLKPRQARARVVRRQIADGLEQRRRQVAADHRRRLQHTAIHGRQPKNPGGEHVVHGLGHAHLCRLVLVAQHAYELLEEEGIAFRPGEDGRHHGRLGRAATQDGFDEVAAGLGR